MIAAGAGDWFFATVTDGSVLLAIPVALLAGLVSFLSPCVVPLLPGYLSYVSGVSVDELETTGRSRLVAGSFLFVLGFTGVFVAGGALFGSVGQQLMPHQRLIQVIAGGLLIVFGLVFTGRFALMQRDVRWHRLPGTGVIMAPVLGVVFGVGWTPCIGPTLSAVLLLANNEATMGRGAFLTFVYCLGLGVPFVIAALSVRRFARASRWFSRHHRTVALFGGGMLMLTGVLLLTGLWAELTVMMQHWISGFEVII